jgi:tRNA 2-thiouridine synthesizing protein A
MADTDSPGDSLRTDTVLLFLERAQGVRCIGCGANVCGHEAVMSLAMGFKSRPRCLSCLAAGLAREPRELRDHLFTYVDHHECLRAGWDWATRREGFELESPPACLWGEGEEVASLTDDPNDRPHPGTSPRPVPDAEWDAGDAGCGDLVLDLRIRLQSMKPGEILKLTARDPGAPEDLPAWCRLTGHSLLSSQHPEYWIERKEG